MTYPNHCYSVIQSRFLAYLLMAALCSGCAQVQHINGSWTGKVEAVTARDRFGSEYRIAALRLESGPEWTAANVEYDGSGAIIERINPVVGGGQLPLLAQHVDGHYCTTGAEDWPVGTRIRLWGKMVQSHAEAPHASKLPSRPENVSREVKYIGEYLAGESYEGSHRTQLFIKVNDNVAMAEHLIIVRKWCKVTH